MLRGLVVGNGVSRSIWRGSSAGGRGLAWWLANPLARLRNAHPDGLKCGRDETEMWVRLRPSGLSPTHRNTNAFRSPALLRHLRCIPRCRVPVLQAGPVLGVPDPHFAVIAAGGHEEIDSRNVLMVTQFGEIYAQGWPGILVVWSEHQDILVAGRMRGDGNADVIGSLNLDTLENLATSEAKALFENFVQAYSGYGVFQFVDSVPELLSFRPDEEQSHSANKPSGI